MSAPLNMWTNLLAFGAVMPVQQMYEMRMENDAQGRILYMGMTTIPNGSVSDPIWYIIKMEYDANDFTDRVRKPDEDLGLRYSWNARASYFT